MSRGQHHPQRGEFGGIGLVGVRVMALDDDEAPRGIPGQRQRGHPELVLDGHLQGPGIGQHRFGALPDGIEEVEHLVGQDGHLALLQGDRIQPVPGAGLQEEGPHP